MKNWLAIESLAEDVGISPRTAWRWLKAGKIRKGEDESGRRVFTLANGANMSRDACHDRQDISMSVDGAGGKTRGRRDPRFPSGIGKGFDPASHVRQQVAAEEARLTLRQIQEAHHSLDQKEQERARRAREEQEAAVRKERERQEAALRAQREAAEARERVRQEAVLRERREADDAATRKRRAELVQKVLDDVVEQYFGWQHEIPPTAKAEALREVRRELSALPDLEEIPPGELREIAAGVRDKVYAPVFEAQDEAKRREEERRKEARRAEEERRHQAEEAMEERFRKEKLRTARIETGRRRARMKLEGVMAGWDRQAVINAVEAALHRELTGDESPADIEKLVDEVLAPHLAKAERRAEQEREEKRKGELIEYGKRFLAEQCAEELPPSGIDRFLVVEEVKRALEKELTGDESEEEVEDLTEELLGKELRK